MQENIQAISQSGLILDWISAILGPAFFLALLPICFEAWKFFKESNRDRLASREQNEKAMRLTALNSYRELETKYLDFLKLNIEYPHLGASNSGFVNDSENLSDEDRVRRHEIYAILFSIFERAYIDRNLTAEIENNQWPGWDVYIRYYLTSRGSLRDQWINWTENGTTASGLDVRFDDYMNKIVSEISVKKEGLAR